jgi:predicted heme/steroid binding protein
MLQEFFSYVSSTIVPKFVLGTVVTITVATSSLGLYKLVESLPTISDKIMEVSSTNDKFEDTELSNNKLKDDSSSANVVLADNQNPSNLCLIIISGKTYNVTSLKNTHSGGDIFKCGTDMTNTYLAQHGSNMSRMAGYLYTGTQTASNSNSGSGTGSQSSGSSNSANSFNSTTLALHNKQGDCYVAYNGTVYNVSNHPSWNNCAHHGITGGRDISSIFPHSTTYFASLPVVGTFSNSTTGGSTGTTTHVDDDGNDDDKNESHEEENEHNGDNQEDGNEHD